MLSLAMFGGRVMRATGLARLFAGLPGRVGFAMAMLGSTKRKANSSRPHPQSNGSRGSVSLLTGCVMEGLFTETNRATERVLLENEYGLTDSPGQGCCGALHAHAGDAPAAKRLAKTNIAAFERTGAQHICVNAAGCGAMMRDYGHLLREDPQWADRASAISARVRDISELLAAAGPAQGGPLSAKVAYDAPCHLLHAQRVSTPPLSVLRAIPGLEMIPLNESDVCCGSAGIYNLVEPETSDIVLERKLRNIAAASPEIVATGNPGCLMQIGAGLLRSGSSTRTVHPVELLDQSYANRAPAT
jgi:glycolate dehydrogenase iron-sulfur subunit